MVGSNVLVGCPQRVKDFAFLLIGRSARSADNHRPLDLAARLRRAHGTNARQASDCDGPCGGPVLLGHPDFAGQTIRQVSRTSRLLAGRQYCVHARHIRAGHSVREKRPHCTRHLPRLHAFSPPHFWQVLLPKNDDLPSRVLRNWRRRSWRPWMPGKASLLNMSAALTRQSPRDDHALCRRSITRATRNYHLRRRKKPSTLAVP